MNLSVITLLVGRLLFVSITPASAQVSGSSWVKIVESVAPAVVVIQTDKSVGSGFLVKSDGTLVTNSHVIAGANKIIVKLSNGETYGRAYILSSDTRRDIAILRVEAANVPALTLGNSNESRAGEEVLLVGAPRGLEQTVSSGIISGIRVLEDGNRVLQTTTPASPGSSGGPLLDRNGEVIGVMTFSLINGQNLNFAIPINYIRGMLDALSLTTMLAPPILINARAVASSNESDRERVPASPPSFGSGDKVFVRCGYQKYVELRSAPGSFLGSTKLACGAELVVISQSDLWVHVRVSQDRRVGYLSSYFLSREASR